MRQMDNRHDIDRLADQHIDLAALRLGGAVVYATDDFFAEKENLIKPAPAVFIPDKFTDRGKWMDGWESRRKRDPGHDWAVVKLATCGCIHGFDIDTSHFLGNHPPHASVEAIRLREGDEIEAWDKLPWREVLTRSPLDPGSHNFFTSNDQKSPYTHVRLHIYPDGGIARLRVYGDVHRDWDAVNGNESLDLAAAINGGKCLSCSDMFFSKMSNLILPGRGVSMGDGWETRRSREEGHYDWVTIRLASPGSISQIVVDTAHFKGNYPETCLVEGCHCSDDEQVYKDNVEWITLTGIEELGPDIEHTFNSLSDAVITHVRLRIYPDGGVSRLRILGKPVRS